MSEPGGWGIQFIYLMRAAVSKLDLIHPYMY